MKKIIFLLFLLPHLNASPQNFKILSRNAIDSLVKILPGSGIIKQVDILNQLAYSLAPVNFDSSIIFSSRAARLSTQYGYTRGSGLSKFNTGHAYYFKMDFKNALVSYLSAQSLLEKGPYNNEMGDVCVMLGQINFFIMRGGKAIAYYRKALGYYEAAGNEKPVPGLYSAMGLTMDHLNYGQMDSALLYGHKLLDYSRKHKDRYMEALALLEIGQFYISENRSARRQLKTLAYNDSSLKLATELKNDILISIIYNNLGAFYDRSSPLFEVNGNLMLSRSCYEKAYKAALKNESNYMRALIPNYIADIDIETGKFKQAEINLDLSEAGLNNFSHSPAKYIPGEIINSFEIIWVGYLLKRERKDLYYSRWKLAVAKGEYRKAIEYQELYHQSLDSLNEEQQGRQFELLMTEDEAERQSQKIRALAQDNELNQLKLSRTRFIFISSGAGFVLVSLILLLFFQRRRLRAERKSVLMEQRLLRAQMNPHFIFNSLASIQNFVINENSDRASIYLSRFSQLVRNILDNSAEEYVPLETEISTIENYLELQKVRYSGKFEYKITVDEGIDSENILIPPMLAQPFIENAIEHGIRHKVETGHIDIRFLLNDGIICFEVEDDGVGREKAHKIESTQRSRHRSMATSITRDRLQSLNKKLKKKIRMEIIDLKDVSGQGCGTRVAFGIPVGKIGLPKAPVH